jgi:hypothetical protein
MLPIYTDTDAQSLTLNGNILSISNGNSVTIPTLNFANGTNTTISGNGTVSNPFQINTTITDTSIYANNGVINQATTVNNNRIVDMNNSNIWFNSANSTTNGNIYIGDSATYPTNTGDYKLYVEGGILTEKVKVALRSTANWADYVFADNYELMPLKDVEKFINSNKHLPGIKSAKELMEDARKQFVGHISQIPPLFSAIKVKGKRAYEAAREGKTLELKPREIEIKEFEIDSLNFPEISFRVICSKGTYIRSLARDFGVAVDSGAYLSELRRTKIGDFSVENAESVENMVQKIKDSNEDLQ